MCRFLRLPAMFSRAEGRWNPCPRSTSCGPCKEKMDSRFHGNDGLFVLLSSVLRGGLSPAPVVICARKDRMDSRFHGNDGLLVLLSSVLRGGLSPAPAVICARKDRMDSRFHGNDGSCLAFLRVARGLVPRSGGRVRRQRRWIPVFTGMTDPLSCFPLCSAGACPPLGVVRRTRRKDGFPFSRE